MTFVQSASRTEAELASAVQVEIVRLAGVALAEHYRRERAYRHPFNVAGRAAHGLWRSIITGGWE